MGALLESAHCGVIELDPSGRIVALNARAHEVLRTGEGLAGAETEVAVMLAEGHTLRDIATATGRSPHTVRWHLYQIFIKNRISRQAELVQLIRSLGVLERGQH